MSRTDPLQYFFARFLKFTSVQEFNRLPPLMSYRCPSDVTSGDEFGYDVYQYRMFLNVDDYDEIYVGGDQVVLKLDVNDYRIIEVGDFSSFHLFLFFYVFENT